MNQKQHVNLIIQWHDNLFSRIKVNITIIVKQLYHSLSSLMADTQLGIWLWKIHQLHQCTTSFQCFLLLWHLTGIASLSERHFPSTAWACVWPSTVACIILRRLQWRLETQQLWHKPDIRAPPAQNDHQTHNHQQRRNRQRNAIWYNSPFYPF